MNSVDEVFNALENENYDHVIDLHKNFRSIVLRRKLSIQSSSFPKLNLQKWMLVNFKIDRMPDIHIVDRYFEAVKVLGVKNDLKGLDYFIPTTDEVVPESLPDGFKTGYVAFVIGGQYQTKQLPVEKAIELCEKIKSPIIILGGPDDVAAGERIAAGKTQKIFNSCGKYSINQSASLIKQAVLVITNDTGLMHVAAAFHKRIISIWGNTVPQFGMYPYLPNKAEKFSIYEVKGLNCRPCSKIGFAKCPKGHFKCMMKQDLEKMAGEVNGGLG